MIGVRGDRAEREHAERVLKASKQRFRTLAESFPVGVFENDAAGRCIYVNDATTRLVGLSASECMGFGWTRALFEEDRARIQERWQRCLRTLQSFREEYRFRHADGTLIWVIGQVAVLTDDVGRHTGFIGMLTDITARKRVEEELRESEERYRDLVENSRDLLCTHDLEGKLLSVNAAAVRLTGYSREALLRMSMADLLTSGGRDLFGAYLREIREQGVASGLMRIRTARGESRWWEYHNTLRTEGVAAPIVRGMAQDITERKRAEEASHQSRQLLEKVFAGLDDAIFLIDPSTRRVTFCNAAVRRVFGYTESEILGRNTEFLHVDRTTYDEFGKQLFPALAAHGFWRTEYRMRRKDGSTFASERVVSEIVDDHGRRTGVVSVVRDITERNRAEQELRDSAKRLQGLSRRLVEAEETERRNINRELHDRVGQNLAALNINLNLVRSQLPQESLPAVDGRFRDVQRLLEETAVQIRNVMTDLHPPMLDEYGLWAALRGYVEAFRARLAIPVLMEGEDLVPRLPRAAEMALFRVAQGALANAAAHAHAKRIEVALAATPGRVTLTIADDGVGFDTAHARQARASWGLAIMSERAQAVGATLGIDSAPGRGTRVVLEIERESA